MESLHYLLMKAHTRMHRRIRIQAAELGLTSGQPKILEYLFQTGESNQKAIAEYCEIEQATVGNLLTRMEIAGLIVRYQRQGDRRSVYVMLTSEGQAMAKRMKEVFLCEEQQESAVLTEQEQYQLRQLLWKLCGHGKEDPV